VKGEVELRKTGLKEKVGFVMNPLFLVPAIFIGMRKGLRPFLIILP
jgi:hypothetical protein